MTYYVINNYIENCFEYFVPTQEEKDFNDHINCFVGGIQEAQQKILKIKNDFIEQENYRFYAQKEIINGNDVILINANLDSDVEDYEYKVFNTFTHSYENFLNLSDAKLRISNLKDQFFNQYSWDVAEIDALPVKNKLKIPVEIM